MSALRNFLFFPQTKRWFSPTGVPFLCWSKKKTTSAKRQLPCVCQAFPVNSADSHFIFGRQGASRRRNTRMHKRWCLFSTLLLERQIWITCSVVRSGSTGMFNRSSSCFLPRESNYCEIVFCFFGWSPTSLILINPLALRQTGSSLWPTYSWTQRKVEAESVILFSNCDFSCK